MLDLVNEEMTTSVDILDLDDFYVWKINWLVNSGRIDLVDEIADEFERRRDGRGSSA